MKRILPAYPLFIKDPYFSLWQSTEELNSEYAETWFSEKKKIYGFLKTKDKTFCFMGRAGEFLSSGVSPMRQTAVTASLFSTDYEFTEGEISLKLSFVSPLPLDDLKLLSLPVCYVKYEVSGVEDAEISLFVNRNIAFNTTKKTSGGYVRGGVMKNDGFESAFLGLSRQLPLSNTEDELGADWGYFYVSGKEAYLADEEELSAYLVSDAKTFSANGEEKYIAAFSSEKSGIFTLGFDDVVSINYFGDFLKGYYLCDHTITDAITYVRNNVYKIEKQLSDFENALLNKAKKFGEDYINILYASYRQSIGAHKLVADREEKLLWLSKECGSNGCIATVDVSYPSMPLYLLFSPELVKGMMRPIVKFARMPVWEYDFAPHDVGTYPACTGQVYGRKQTDGNKYHGRYIFDGSKEMTWTNFPVYILPKGFDGYKYESQMPVEESADMIIMTFAAFKADGDLYFFNENADLFAKWVEYLVKYGLKPEDQLCTDDFAGRLKNNLNLAIKATVGIAAYAEFLRAAGNETSALKYRKVAKDYADKISDFAKGKTHLPLTWDSEENTFGIKYNLAFDKIYGLGLFGRDLREKETDYYLSVSEKYGCPLDNRENHGKSDWLIWAAALTDDETKREKLLKPVAKFLEETPDRIPFSDWYDVKTGKSHEFKARSTQGACFILMLNV